MENLQNNTKSRLEKSIAYSSRNCVEMILNQTMKVRDKIFNYDHVKEIK